MGGRVASPARPSPLLKVPGQQRDGDPVVPLGPDRLDRRGAHARLRGEQLVELADAMHAGVLARVVDHRSLTDDVVHDDQAPLARELERPREVFGDARLVCVDEDEVEGTWLLRGKLGQGVERPPEAYFHDAAKAGARDAGSGNLGVVGLGLQGDEGAVLGGGSAYPNRAGAAEGSYLEGRPRAL